MAYELGSADYVAPADRMATVDNDGTLWCEQPVVQLAFASVRLKQMLPSHSEWNQRQAIQAPLKGDVAYFEREGEQALAEVVAITHTGITVEQFQQAAAEFFRTGKHPKYGGALEKQRCRAVRTLYKAHRRLFFPRLF